MLGLITNSAINVTLVSYGLFLALYTQFDKQTKTIKPQMLIDIITMKNGYRNFLVENNKVLALNGLTILGLAFLNFFSHIQHDLIMYGLLQIILHSGFSAYDFYGTPKMPSLEMWKSFKGGQAKHVKKFSIVAGVVAYQSLIAYYFKYLDAYNTGVLTMFFGVVHFYLMEIDFRWVLGVRPYGFLPFFTSLAALLVMFGFLNL